MNTQSPSITPTSYPPYVAHKPLGGRAYPSIGHLPSSRLGPGDHHVPDGQARICTKDCFSSTGTRRVIVTIKYDGSCCAILRYGDDLIPLVRAGYIATTSPRLQHYLFSRWVARNRDRIMPCLKHGQRLCGEWLIQAHGTRYDIRREIDLFRPFDIMEGNRRIPWDEFELLVIKAVGPGWCVECLGEGPWPTEKYMSNAFCLSGPGDYDRPNLDAEGVVYRVEYASAGSYNYQFEFAAKYVRHDKIDGQYLPEISGKPPVWNYPPEEFLKW